LTATAVAIGMAIGVLGAWFVERSALVEGVVGISIGTAIAFVALLFGFAMDAPTEHTVSRQTKLAGTIPDRWRNVIQKALEEFKGPYDGCRLMLVCAANWEDDATQVAHRDVTLLLEGMHAIYRLGSFSLEAGD
jgi:hypothetical protein